MPIQLQNVTFYGDEPVTSVQVFLGDGPDAEHSKEWISAQLAVQLPVLKSVPFQRLIILQQMQNKVQHEIDRLSRLYSEAEKAPH